MIIRTISPGYSGHRLAAAVLAALVVAAASFERPDSSARPAAVKPARLREINALPHRGGPLPPGPLIFLYQRYPLSGNYPPAAFDTAAKKIEALLARRGRVREIGAGDLSNGLFKRIDTGGQYRYLVTPCEIGAVTHEKKLEVGSFVKLNREGDFVPTKSTRAIDSRTTEVTVRFVMVDCASATVVFDDREKATVSDDEAVQGAAPKNEKKGVRTPDQVRTGVIRIAPKVAAKLRNKLFLKAVVAQ